MKILRLEAQTLGNIRYFLSRVILPNVPPLDAAAMAREWQACLEALDSATDEPAPPGPVSDPLESCPRASN